MFRVKPVKHTLFLGLAFGLWACGPSAEAIKSKKETQVEVQEMDYYQDQKFQQVFFDAQRKKAVEDYEGALKLFQKCLDIYPQSDIAFYEIALIHQMAGNYQLAFENLNQALSLAPNNKWYRETKVELHNSLGQYELAAEGYATLYEQNPKNLEWKYNEAIALINAKEFKKAIDALDYLEKEVGIQEDIIRQKEELYLRMGDLDKAVAEVQKLIDSKPSEPRYYGIMAELYAANDKMDLAKEYLEKVLELDPSLPQALVTLSDIYRREGNSEQAIELMKRAFDNPDFTIDSKIQILGSYYQIAAQEPSYLPEAFELLNLALKHHDDNARIYAVKGDFHIRKNELDEALTAYKKAIELGEEELAVYTQIFNLQIQKQDYKELLEYSDEALILYPNQGEVYLFQGLAQNQLKLHKEAINTLNTGLIYAEAQPRMKAQFYMYLGDAHHALQEHEKSDEAYEKSLALDANNAYLLNNYAYYLSIRGEDLDKAERMSKRSLQLIPNTASFQDTYAWIMYKMGRYSEALDYITKAMGSGLNASGEMLEHYGDILYKLGRVDEALEQWKKAEGKEGTSEFLAKKIQEGKLYE